MPARKTPPSPKRTKAYQFGLWAEWLVILYLWLHCYRILKRRYRTPVGEVDIIASRGNILVCIEVKAREQLDKTDSPLTHTQQQRITRAAEYFLQKHPYLTRLQPRFDVMIVTPPCRIRYLRNAW